MFSKRLPSIRFHRLMAAERRRRTCEAAARLAREAEEEEAAAREEVGARKEAAEARRKEDERWIFQLKSDLVTQHSQYIVQFIHIHKRHLQSQNCRNIDKVYWARKY